MTNVVVFLAERIEGSLLRGTCSLHRPDSLTLECAMHSLVSTVLIRPSRQDALMLNPKTHPPDVEKGEAVDRLRREWHSVMGANRERQSILSKSSLEYRSSRNCLSRQQSVTSE